MINEKEIKKLIEHTKETLSDLYATDDFDYDSGPVYYTKEDIAVIYKMNRLYELKAITKEELYELINLYHEYIELTDLFIDEETEARLFEVEEKLDDLELLPHYLDPAYLVDQTINKDQFVLRLKKIKETK